MTPEALELARRLQESDARSAAQDRRALLLFWYGTGASHLLLEASAGAADRHARLGAAIADIAARPLASPAELRRVGRDLAALDDALSAAR